MVRKGVIGIPQDGRMTACSYTVKHYEEGSVFGIDGGRVSKLAIKIDGKTTCCYDRGWDCEPEDDATKAALAILIMEYN